MEIFTTHAMKKQIWFFLLSIPTGFVLHAQAPEIQWQHRMGGSGFESADNFDIATDGYILGSSSDSNISADKTEDSRGGIDYWIVKTDETGTRQWDKTIGGASPEFEEDFLTDIKVTFDGGFILCGTSNSPLSGEKMEAPINGSYDYWIVKTDSNGVIQWQNVIGGDGTDVPTDMDVTSDGGYIIGGRSESTISADKTEDTRGAGDYWIVKLDAAGNVQWDKTLGGSEYDYLTSINQTVDGGYLVAGYSLSGISGDKTEGLNGGFDLWIIKLDATGAIVWQNTIGGSGDETMVDVVATTDGGYLLPATSISPVSGDKTEPNRGVIDLWMVKISESGAVQWDKTLGGSEDDSATTALESSDGNFVVVGYTMSPVSGDKTVPLYGEVDSWVLKINSMGSILWQKEIGGSGEEALFKISETSDGGYFLSGGTTSEISNDIVDAPLGGYDLWTLKLAPDDLKLSESPLTEVKAYPNPALESVNIHFKEQQQEVRFSLVNVLAQVVSVHDFTNIGEATIPLSGASGIYFLTIEGTTGRQTLKISKQ